MSKPAFPQTPEGVTDWEKVFEDPDGGLIPVIAAAHTPDALKNCLVVVIKRLFTRQSDELELARLLNQIEGLFAAEDAGLPTAAAVALLRQIKDHRIEKARLHLAKKARRRKRDRRSGSGAKKLALIFYRLFKDPRYLLGLIAVLLLALGLIIALVSGVLDFKPVPAPQTADLGAAPGQPEPADKRVPMEAPPLDLSKPDKPDKFPPTIVLRRMTLPRSFSGAQQSLPYVMPILVLDKEGAVSAVCGQLPYLLSMINVALSDALSKKSAFGDADLDRIGARLAGQINGKLGERLVGRVILARPPDLKYNPTSKCGLTPLSSQEYLKSFVQP